VTGGGDGEQGDRDRESLRVVLFSNNYRPRVSGVAVAVDFLERALHSAGHQTLVVAPDYDPARSEGRAGVLRVRSIPLRPWKAALPIPRREQLLAEIASFRPHLLHSHHPFLLGRFAIRAARTLGIPLVYTFHTFYEAFLETVGIACRPLARFVQKRMQSYLRRCDLVVAPTEPVRAWLEHELAPTVPTAAVPTGLDATRFRDRSPQEREAIRAGWGFAPHQTVLVWAGRVTAEKNPLLALETLAALRARGYDAKLLVAGCGPHFSAMKNRSEELSLRRHVRLAGFVDRERLPEVLAAGDVFLFTSWTDTQAIVAYEAWAAGLRIVSVRSLAGRALVEPGGNGRLADDDGGAFADAAEDLIRSPDRCRLEFPWSRFGLEALAQTWSGVYLGALERQCAGVREAARPARGEDAVLLPDSAP
jgi:1,2-diacylglycerol 3-alpha-glucosyltransferase